jgi:prolyl-tRNA synthetase
MKPPSKAKSAPAAGGETSGTKVTFSIDKVKDFPDWYDRALDVGDIVDIRYPVKGMYIWKPYGFKALRSMMGIMHEIMQRTGHEEVYFPMLIPESIFGKERDFLKGFKGEAYAVTKAGTEDLAEGLVVRPTSETGMYESIKPWVRSISDLPLKLYQVVNVFRHETKQTRPMLRLREIVQFKEAHTFHATAEEADAQVLEGVSAYKEFFDRLLLPYLIVRTPSWDTFPGAVCNFDFMSVMPDGKSIELASVINLGDKFAKAFGITYQTNDNKQAYVHQTCYGISERVLGVVLAVHGDDKGLILPPGIAPIQVVVVPVFHKGKEDAVKKRAEEVKQTLEKHGFRVAMDIREQRGVGDKYYEWEARGVPVRVEFGPNGLLADITDTLRAKAQEYFKGRVLHFRSVADLKNNYKEREGLVGLPWCQDEKCGRKLEEDIGIPTVGFVPGKSMPEPCASCGKTGNVAEMFFGRTY